MLSDDQQLTTAGNEEDFGG